MPFFFPPDLLEGQAVRVVPLELQHADGLYAIGTDPAIWKWLPLPEFHSLQDSQAYIESALQGRSRGDEFPFAVFDLASERLAGTTRFLEITEEHRGLEIGWTWYGTQFQRTGVNTETKLLLLTYAFEALGAIRVQLKTDSRNLRSQTAIQRIGGCLEGTLRNHRILPKDGYVRDTVYFSILDSEWPNVKSNLLTMLGR